MYISQKKKPSWIRTYILRKNPWSKHQLYMYVQLPQFSQYLMHDTVATITYLHEHRSHSCTYPESPA
jgi:hypothetical protein